jgi:hypothetical protein
MSQQIFQTVTLFMFAFFIGYTMGDVFASIKAKR